jgi:hypothetical protein
MSQFIEKVSFILHILLIFIYFVDLFIFRKILPQQLQYQY